MKKLVLFVVLGCVAATSLWAWRRGDAPRDGVGRLVIDRIWIDHVPRNDKDTINIFAMVSEHSAGVFNATSQWRGNFEVFRYETKDGELRMVFPQTNDRDTVRAKARRCNDGGMDFCLELGGASRGVKKYYSREGWEIDAASDVDALERRIDALRGQL